VPEVEGLDITMWPLYRASSRSAQARGGVSLSSSIFFRFTAKPTARSVTPCHMFSGCLKRAGIACESLATYGSRSPLSAAPVR